MTKKKVDFGLLDYIASQETPPPRIQAILLICDIKDFFQEALSITLTVSIHLEVALQKTHRRDPLLLPLQLDASQETPSS